MNAAEVGANNTNPALEIRWNAIGSTIGMFVSRQAINGAAARTNMPPPNRMQPATIRP